MLSQYLLYAITRNELVKSITISIAEPYLSVLSLKHISIFVLKEILESVSKKSISIKKMRSEESAKNIQATLMTKRRKLE